MMGRVLVTRREIFSAAHRLHSDKLSQEEIINKHNQEEIINKHTQEEPEPEGKPDGDDVGHLELAWEMLELAKSIWATCGKTDMEALALHYLGEVRTCTNS